MREWWADSISTEIVQVLLMEARCDAAVMANKGQRAILKHYSKWLTDKGTFTDDEMIAMVSSNLDEDYMLINESSPIPTGDELEHITMQYREDVKKTAVTASATDIVWADEYAITIIGRR
jgi:hypothetical protein